MAGKRRNSQREQLWRASGLSIPAFCQRHTLTPSAFYYWRRALRERDAAAGPTSRPALPAFVLVRVVPSAMVAAEVRCPSGHVVPLPAYDDIIARSQGTIIEVACWVQARRKFVEAEATSPQLAHEAVVRIKALYVVEYEAKGSAE